MGCGKKLRLSFDGSDSGSRMWKRGCGGAFGGSLESGDLSCVGTSGRNVASKMIASTLTGHTVL